MENWVIINFFIALAIGAIIGLEREIVHQKNNTKDFGGVRNFVLIALFGFFLTYFSLFLVESKAILIIGFVGFFVLIAAAYIVIGLQTKRVTTTSEIAALVTFILSCFIATDSNPSFRLIAIIATIIVTSLLAFKKSLHKFAKKIQMEEVFAIIKMAIISIVILPLLPNKNYSLVEIPLIKDIFFPGTKVFDFLQQLNVFNPFKIWLIVIFITGLSFIGYFLIKITGEKRGLGLTGFLGGIVSSTAVTVSISKKSKGQKEVNSFALAIVLASSMMFLRVLLEVLIVNRDLVGKLTIPLGVMALIGFFYSFFIFFKRDYSKKKNDFTLKNPFELNTAIKFGLFFLVILILSKGLYILMGDAGIYLVSVFSGLADVDAITITVSSLASSGLLNPKVAVLAITLAISTNTLVKAGITAVIGEKKLAKKIMSLFFIILLIGILLAIIV